MKYAFNDELDNWPEGMGISPERTGQLFNAAKDICKRAIFTDENIPSKVVASEIYLNEVQPQNTVDAFFAGVAFMDVWAQSEALAKKVAAMMSEDNSMARLLYMLRREG